MNTCGSGDMGTPEETAAMGDGLAWANLAFEPPWGVGSNDTYLNITLPSLLGLGNQSNSTRRSLLSRMLLQTPTAPAPPAPPAEREEGTPDPDAPVAGELPPPPPPPCELVGGKKNCAKTGFQGTMFVL